MHILCIWTKRLQVTSLVCFGISFVVCEVNISHLLFKFQFWVNPWTSLKCTSVTSTTLKTQCIHPGAPFTENYLICVLLSCWKGKGKRKHEARTREIQRHWRQCVHGTALRYFSKLAFAVISTLLYFYTWGFFSS